MTVYTVTYHCDNCGAVTRREFSRGTVAPVTEVCDACGCFTARKQVGPALLVPLSPRPWPRDPWPERPDPLKSPYMRSVDERDAGPGEDVR